jgi:hypothetical protein
MDAMKLHLRLISPSPRLRMVWNRRPDGVIACGPVTVEFLADDGTASGHWYTRINGHRVCRSYGYSREREAMAAAPHLKVVRRLLK